MTTPAQSHLAAMMTAAELEWRTYASEDWTEISFWRRPRGFHRSAWVIAGYIGWNPLDVLDKPTPAAHAVNALLTRLCVTFTFLMTRHIPDHRDPDEPSLAWFNATAREHQHGIAEMIEGLGDAYWHLPTSRRWAARRLVRMWEKDCERLYLFVDTRLALVLGSPRRVLVCGLDLLVSQMLGMLAVQVQRLHGVPVCHRLGFVRRGGEALGFLEVA